MTTQIQTDDTKVSNKNIVLVSENDKLEIEKTFADAKDFRSIWEKITAPFDSIVSESARIIDNDPIMNVSDELAKVNSWVQEVYSEIINNDGTIMKMAKSIPLFWALAKALDKKIDDTSFNLKWVEWKIGVIFSGFDTSYNSLNTSIDLQKKFLDWITNNISKVQAYKNYIELKINDFKSRIEVEQDIETKEKLNLFLANVETFYRNLQVLIWNLKLTEKRLLMRLDSANKLSLSMSTSRPIFKTLLSTAMIETSAQKAQDASARALEMMGQTIDNMSSQLTDQAIASSKKAEEINAKWTLSTQVFVDNVEKLKTHFEWLEQYRKTLSVQASKDAKDFEDAKNKLDSFKSKVLDKTSQDELDKEIKLI